MIPEFPNFKPLELSDRNDFLQYTSGYAPYSDLNFVSLWSWDLGGVTAIAQMRGNLVVRMRDYLTQTPFCTFIGANHVDQTCEDILAYSVSHRLSPALHMVPEVVAQQVDARKYSITESRDHFDYVYELTDLRDYRGTKYAKKRNEVNQFLRMVPTAQAKTISLRDPEVVPGVLDLFRRWQRLKQETGKDASAKDIDVMRRMLAGVHAFDLVTVAVYEGTTPVAILISELVGNEYAVGHLMKADTSMVSGVYAFLMQRSAEVLLSHGVRYLNYEQDLGLENLRHAKTLFRPRHFLKKYTLSYQDL